MSGMARFSSQAGLQSLFLIICLISVMLSFGLHSLNAGDNRLANPLLDSHHTGDSDNDTWLRYSLPILLTGFVLMRMDVEKPIQHSIVPSPQLPPPK